MLKGQAVVVACQEARRALADALPFLTRAKTALVAEVCGKDEAADVELRTQSVVAGLKRHDVNAHGRVVVAAADRVAAELNSVAKAPDLIIAGGYGHSRLGEMGVRRGHARSVAPAGAVRSVEPLTFRPPGLD